MRRRVFVLALAVAAAFVLLAGWRQPAPNATRAVIGARQMWCTPDQRFVITSHSGWLPTANCRYLPPVPDVPR
jgi:hypothetical protein